jgi:hypothetical protein
MDEMSNQTLTTSHSYGDNFASLGSVPASTPGNYLIRSTGSSYYGYAGCITSPTPIGSLLVRIEVKKIAPMSRMSTLTSLRVLSLPLIHTHLLYRPLRSLASQTFLTRLRSQPSNSPPSWNPGQHLRQLSSENLFPQSLLLPVSARVLIASLRR